MRFKRLVAVAALAFTLTACEVAEDGETAADKAAVNQKTDGPKAKGKAKSDGPKETVAQENARESAENYLSMSAFSRKGLIKQLEFEGFSKKDATYGVDAQKADWMKQAAASGESYLEMSSFSRAGLIDQLVFEGFTKEQAEHGATANGL